MDSSPAITALQNRIMSLEAIVSWFTSGIIISAGAGVPTKTQPAGSMYMRTDGSTGSRIYVSAGGGVWNAVAGV